MNTTAPSTTLIGRLLKSCEDLREIVEVDGEFVGADLLGADRRDEVLPRQRIADVGGREIVGVQRVLVEVDLHLPHRAAIGVRESGRPRPS